MIRKGFKLDLQLAIMMKAGGCKVLHERADLFDSIFRLSSASFDWDPDVNRLNGWVCRECKTECAAIESFHKFISRYLWIETSRVQLNLATA